MGLYHWVQTLTCFAQSLRAAVDPVHSIADSVEMLLLRAAILLIFVVGLYAIYARLIAPGRELDSKSKSGITKNYYYDPKSRDLAVFDTETNEIFVLERIEGIRVLGGSEIDRPADDDSRPARPLPPIKKDQRQRFCKKCGQPGHRADSKEFHPAA